MNGQWGARRWADLVGCVLADKYMLVKNLEAVRGSCGCPFICEDLTNNGNRVFIKLLDGAEYSLNREVAEVDYMVDMKLRHNNLVEMLEVIKNATVVKRSGNNFKGADEVLAQGVTAIVSEYAPGGDLFDYLFAPVHTGRPRPFAFPEPLARHIGRQLIDGVLYLHGHEIYHRDLKPENVVFDESYNAKITDFGMNSVTPAEATEFPRAQTMHQPTTESKWTVGTEAYAPPEVRGSFAVEYDPAQYDSWSLGMVLLMMVGVDKLEIVTHLLMRGNQQVKEKVVRMPFVGYRTTNGDRPNMLFNLEPCADSYTGDLSETPPQHLLFWAEFPSLSSALSPLAKDLFNRVLVREPAKRITLSQMLKHPWFQEGSKTELTPDYFQREMMPRQPNKAQSGTNVLVYLGSGPDAGISQAELRRNLKMGAEAGSSGSQFPPDSKLEKHMCLFDAGPSGEYNASKLFAGISQAVTSWGLRQPVGKLSTSMLVLTAYSDRGANASGEEFHIEVLVVGKRTKVLMRNFPVSTQWEHWKAELELFCQNYCKLMEPKKKEALKPAAAPLQALTQHMEVESSSSQNLMRSESASLGSSMETEEGAQDWWPECTKEEQQQYMLLWAMFGQPTDGFLRKEMFLRYMERTSGGITPVEMEAVWHLVVPKGGWMKQNHWMMARYLISRMLEGRTLPQKFPETVFPQQGGAAQMGLGGGKSTVQSSIVPTMGSLENPFRYDTFAYLFRPLLENEFRKVNKVWRKFAPVLVLCPSGMRPFTAGSYAVNNNYKWKVCNICTPLMESWGMKCSNLHSNYTSPPMDHAITFADLHPSTPSSSLRRITLQVAQALGAGPFSDFTDETWLKMQRTLWEHMRGLDNAEKCEWRFAVPTNTVVALSLSPPNAPDLLKMVLQAVGISYFGGPLYREETYKKAEEFGPDYYLVSDLSLNSMNIFGLGDLTPGRNMTHDKEWVWKNTNKVFRGQTLITRTIHKDIFLNTYRQEDMMMS